MPRISTDNYDTVASWNGSQDLFVVEQPDGTKVATPAMVKQYVLGNSIDDIYSVMGQMGAKNLIPYPYFRPNHVEVSGITYDVSSDGIITMQTGNSTAEADYHMWNRSDANTSFHLDKGTYILSGCDVNAPDGVSLILNGKDKNGNNKNVIGQTPQYPDGIQFTIDDTFDLDRFGVLVYCRSGVTISSALTFKPMIRLAPDTDDTYQPYAMTNKQLTEQVATKQDTLTFDNVPTQNSNNPVKSGGIYTALSAKHNTDTVEFVGNVTMASNYLGTITASSLGISDCTKYNWDIRSKSWEAFPQIANVTTSSVTFYVRWLSSASGGSVSLKNSGEVQITLTGMTRHDI